MTQASHKPDSVPGDLTSRGDNYLSKQATILALAPGRVCRKIRSLGISVSSYLSDARSEPRGKLGTHFHHCHPADAGLGCLLSVALSLGFTVDEQKSTIVNFLPYCLYPVAFTTAASCLKKIKQGCPDFPSTS